MVEFSFPHIGRITRTQEYREVYRKGRRVPSANFLLFHRPAADGQTRIGLSSGRKVGKAVVRNRVKRRMREILRRQRPSLTRPADLILVAHPSAASLLYGEMEREITTMLRAAHLLPKE